MRLFSMFSGIGGFEYGFERAYNNGTLLQGQKEKGVQGDKSGSQVRSERFECIGYSEIDKYAIQVYEHHFPGVKNYGNAFDVQPEGLPDFDILVGGFPCQSFSIAGKRGGFEDTRGTLFFEIARIISVKRPKLLLLENVRGLLSHDRGRTFGTILATLSDLGYVCEWQVLNSKDFGVPQNRERVFIVGHLGEIRGQAVFPIREDDTISDSQNKPEQGRTQAKLSGTLRGSNIKADNTFIVENTKRNPQATRVRGIDGTSVTLGSQGGGQGAKTGLYCVAQRGRGENNEQTMEARKDGITNTLTGVQKDNMIAGNANIRRLTPTECERLQGYPDGWTEYGTQGKISDSQRYKMAGNSVTTNVIAAIAKRIKETK